MKLPKKFPELRSVITEITSIVIGVLLALAVNEWNESRIQTARANEAIQNVMHEITSNTKFLSFVNANNRAIIELLKERNAQSEDEGERQFVPGLQIQDTAWRMLHSTGVSEFIEYSTLYEISAIYSLQDIYKSLGYQLVQTITNNRALILAVAPDKSEGIDSGLFLSEMILIEQVEEALLSSYAEALEKLENR